MTNARFAATVGLLLVALFCGPRVLPADTQDHRRGFGFGPREIYDFKNDTSRLIVEDLNRDGLDDIVFLNNRMSRIEVLLRKAPPAGGAPGSLPLLDETFVPAGFLLDQKTAYLAVADFDGDQRPDILTGGPQRGLRLYFQTREGRFADAASPAVKHSDQIVQVATADFDGDGALDILVGRRRSAELLYNEGNGVFRRRLVLDYTAADCEGVMAGDFDGDGRQDILLRFPEEQLPLRLFLGRPEGGFGWEYPLETPPMKALKPMALVEKSPDQLLAILQNGVNLRHYRLQREASGDMWEAPRLITARLVARGAGGKRPLSWTLADINRDGRQDYCVSAPELSRIMVHIGTPQGINPVPEEISSLRRIARLGADRRGDLYVFSPEENAVACHGAEAYAAFPAFVDLQGTPLVMDVSPWSEGVFSVVKRRNDRLYFCRADRGGVKRAVPLELPADQPPDAMRVFPVSRDTWGVVLFSPLKKPAMHLWDGRRLTAVTNQQFRALGPELTASDIVVVGTATDPGIMISEGQTARLYRFDGKTFKVERQFSLPDEKAVLKFGLTAAGPAGASGYLFFNQNGNELCWFPEDESRAALAVALADAFPQMAGIVPLAGTEDGGLLLPGRSETRFIRTDIRTYALQTLSGYSSQAENPQLWNLYPLALGTPPRPMAAALDARNATIELLSVRDGELTEEVSFAVFQGPQFNRDDKGWFYEPREAASGDVNGDGLMDLAILVHDKLVIHLGE